MSTDGDLSKASGTDGEPDEFDSVVLDENFIKGGIPEASLRRYQVVREQRALPPQPTEPAGRPEPPTPPRPQWHSSDRDSAAHAEPVHGGETGGSGGPRALGVLLGGAVLLVVLVVLTGLLQLGGAGSGNGLPIAAQAGPGQRVLTLSPAVPPGTCFDVPAGAGNARSMTVFQEPCTQAHEFELVSLEQGQGPNDAYPTAAAWSDIVNTQCTNDLQTYTGQAEAKWQRGLSPAVIPPSADTWATGDRDIYCVAMSQPSTTGSVRAAG